MGNTKNAATIGKVDVLALNAIGDAIFDEWYPNHRTGDLVPVMPPLRVMQEASELALRHRMVAARRREQPAA